MCQILVQLYVGDFHEHRPRNQNLINIGKSIGHLPWRHKYILGFLMPATLNRQKWSLRWKTFQDFGIAGRHQHCANAPQCYVIRKMPIMFFLRVIRNTEIHCVKLQSWMLKPQVNIESLYSKSLFLNRGSVELCGSTLMPYCPQV
jgi:hypothetical protein